MSDIQLRRFQPLHLKLEGVGPFRSAFEMPLTDKDGAPSNFFLLVSRNGFGKTTVLEVIHGLMKCLGAIRSTKYELPASFLLDELHSDLRRKPGKAQLDIRLELEGGGRASAVVLSLYVGTDGPLRALTPSLIAEAQADIWIPAGLPPDRNSWNNGFRVDQTHQWVMDALRSSETTRVGDSLDRWFVPCGEFMALPTALYFTADRRILAPPPERRAVAHPEFSAYSAAHKFTTDGDTWETSLDGLLVWYEWLGGGLFEQAQDLINSTLFSDSRKKLTAINRHTLAAVIEVEQEDGTKVSHGLDGLSHGERSLLHLLVRSAYHRTGSTILLLDEMETHLHPKWQYKLMALLKEWIRKWPDLTVIATTHQPALIEEFAFERPEEGLVKGGYIIEASEL
ncbi:MAG: AAA family ATPase [Magnetospirillum sp. WYHS-4]